MLSRRLIRRLEISSSWNKQDISTSKVNLSYRNSIFFNAVFEKLCLKSVLVLLSRMLVSDIIWKEFKSVLIIPWKENLFLNQYSSYVIRVRVL